MAPSTPPPPASELFAALTMASTASFVMSARITSKRSRTRSPRLYRSESEYLARARRWGPRGRHRDVDHHYESDRHCSELMRRWGRRDYTASVSPQKS